MRQMPEMVNVISSRVSMQGLAAVGLFSQSCISPGIDIVVSGKGSASFSCCVSPGIVVVGSGGDSCFIDPSAEMRVVVVASSVPMKLSSGRLAVAHIAMAAMRNKVVGILVVTAMFRGFLGFLKEAGRIREDFQKVLLKLIFSPNVAGEWWRLSDAFYAAVERRVKELGRSRWG